jgi:D-alanyl-D-alanine carboxypeptidase/D-alanyl-D-alanine-endopeptidase (penicillin-binding protein 4)
MTQWTRWCAHTARVVALASALGAVSLDAARAASPLPLEVDIALDRAKVPRTGMAIVVQEVGAVRPRLSWQARQPMNPASLTKLLTTSAGLELLGPAYAWPTQVWVQGTINQGVLDGQLVIKGNGDPKLVVERLWLLMRRVQQQLGVREIRGDIVLDRSAFQVPPQGPGEFDGEALRPYNVQPDALLINYKSFVLTFTPDLGRQQALVAMDPPLAGVKLDVQVALSNGNCDDWRAALKPDFSDPNRVRLSGSYPVSCGERSWSVAYAEPASYNERVIAGLWREMGGKLQGRVREGQAPTSPPLLSINSPAMSEVVRDINKYSNNVMAQQLFLTLGLVQRGSGTPEMARETMAQWLSQEIGAEAARGAVIDNGSGLSLATRLSAEQFARVLQAAWASPTMPELMSSLPVTGVDGTMRRSRNSPLGRAHVKTGSMPDSGVMALAGYVLGQSGRRYVVVAMVNHPRARFSRPALEAVLQWTALDATREVAHDTARDGHREAAERSADNPAEPARAASRP